jgi:predicted signal transduction protein with EAL and GGDEF domain
MLPYELCGQQIGAAISIGISLSPGDGTTAEELVKKADMALFAAKADGRRRYSFFEPEMDARMQKRRLLENGLKRALVNDEFEIHYQPIVNRKRDQMCGVEALVRWRHPERGMISPAEFIPLAEENGLIVSLGEWVLRRACADAARWPRDIKVAVNLSPVQLMDQKLTQIVISALVASGLPARRLELEITEAVFLNDQETTVATLHRLRTLGVQIVMDDFGTGYSSLSYLRSFPFDKIKIDQSFIRDLTVKEDASKIVRAIASLATSLNMRTTAEGVETQQQLSMVRDLVCTEMQGFLFSRPMPSAEMSAMFLSCAGKAADAA